MSVSLNQQAAVSAGAQGQAATEVKTGQTAVSPLSSPTARKAADAVVAAGTARKLDIVEVCTGRRFVRFVCTGTVGGLCVDGPW